MKLAAGAIAVGVAGLAACTTVTTTSPAPAKQSASAPAAARSSAPATGQRSRQSAQPAAPSSAAPSTAAPSSGTDPNVTDPWAVVSAYYGDVESGNYAQAWALLSSGAVTGQTFQQFKDGYSCTGNQQVSELGESGDQVTFDLVATDVCSGAVQHFTGTDSVVGGKIVAAHITQTS
jgi:hypothetical protein